MERVGIKNKWTITNYELFAREYLKRRVLWDKTASYDEKQDALHFLAEAVFAKLGPRTMLSYCRKFKKIFEKKVNMCLQLCIEKKLPPELTLKRATVPSWVKEMDYHLKYLDQLIHTCRETGKLPPQSNRHLVWSAFVNKMADHCRAVCRLPNEDDVAKVVNDLGWSSEYCEALERLWKINLSSALYKYRRVSDLGHRTLCLSSIEWSVVDLSLLNTTPTTTVEVTFKHSWTVKQLVRLFHFVKLYNIEVDDGVNPKHKWAKVVWIYSREYETSPSGIFLQLRWHLLRQFARNEVMCRLTDAKRKVHPLLVEIATKYPHLLEDDTPWLEKVKAGKVYDVSNVRIVYAEPDGDKKTAAQKKLEVENFYDSDDEKTLVIDEPSSSKAKSESSMPSLNDKLVLNVDDPQNDDVITLSDDSCSQSSFKNDDNIPQSAESKSSTESKPNIKIKLDNLDKDLKKLEKEITEQFLALKRLKISDNNNDDNSDWELCTIKSKSNNDENVSRQITKTKADVAVGKPSSTKYKLKNATDEKIAKKSFKSNKSSKNEAKPATNTGKKNEASTFVENKTLKPNDKLTKSVTDDKEPNKQLVTEKVNQTCKTVVKSNLFGDDPSTSKVSDLELLKKIDPTQAETTIIFSDSESEEDLSKVIGNDQEKKVYNLNDVKKYLSHFSLDDILTKMGDIQVKEEPKLNYNRKFSTFTSISLSDSDEKSTKNGIQEDESVDKTNECVDITNNSSEDEESKAIISKIDISTEKIAPYKNMIRSSITFQDEEIVEDIHKDIPTNKDTSTNKGTSTNKTKVISVDDIPMMKLAKELNNQNPNPIETSNQESHNKNKFGNRPPIKGRRRLPEYAEHSDGLSLFKLKDRKTKETVGVLVNAKNAMKVSDFDVGVCKKVDSYLNEADQNERPKSNTENNEENENVINERPKSTTENMEENDNTINNRTKEEEQDERAEAKELFWKDLLDSSNTKPLFTEKVEDKSDTEEEDAENEVDIDPKIIMETRVYLPKIDEVDSYIINRRVDNSVNIKRFGKRSLKILNYKRKSDAIDNEDALEKRIKLNVEQNVVTYSRLTKTKIVTDDTKTTDHDVPANSRSNLIENLPESIRNEIASDTLGNKNKSSANITQRIKFESDEETQSDDFDVNLPTNNDIPLKIEKPQISDDKMDIDNKSTLDTQNETNNTTTADKNYEIHIKLERMDIDESPSNIENVKSDIDDSTSGAENIKENVKSLKDVTEINDNSSDVDVETLDDEETHQLSVDDDDSKPINNIEEMLKLCKPVKLCLKKVKVPSQNQVRRVELPDRSWLHKHRAPTAHVAPIHVAASKDGNGGDESTKQDISTLLHQLSMETASEWQRLEESILNPQQIRKRSGDHIYVKHRKEKIQKENKKKKKIKAKPPAPEADELTLQNKEWERQKTMNNRYFDLTPKYAKTSSDAAKTTKNKPEIKNRLENKPENKDILENKNENIEQVVLKNTDDKNDDLEGPIGVGVNIIYHEQMRPNETELAVESLIKDNYTNKNDNIQNATCILVNDNINFAKNTAKERQKKEDSVFRWLNNFQSSLGKVNNNCLKPIFTKVERKNELTPIATKVVYSNDSSNAVNTKIEIRDKVITVSKNDAGNTKSYTYYPSTSSGELKKHKVRFTLNKRKDDAIKSKKDDAVKSNLNVDKEPYTPNWLLNLNVKASKTKRKEITEEPKETIVLEDSDEDDTNSNSKVASIIKEKCDETNSNPPVKVLESTLRKTGTTHIYKMMEISPMGANAEENSLNKESSEDCGIIKNVMSVASIDIDDSSNETDKNKPQNKVTIDFVTKNVKAKMQMPKIVSTHSIRDNDIDDSKELKPINSEDECMDSDSDDLHIDETLNYRDVEYLETDLDFSEDTCDKISENNIYTSDNENNQDTNNIITDDIEIRNKNVHITIESNEPQANLTSFTLIEKAEYKKSIQENESYIDSKIENIVPTNTSQENGFNDDKNSVSNTINANSADNTFESNSISTKEVKIKENIEDSPKTDTDVAISDENNEKTVDKDSTKDDSEIQNNTKQIVDTNDNKTDKPRPFLKLVPIQQLLDEKKSEENKSKEIDENIDEEINNFDEDQMNDQLDSIDDVEDDSANRVRGEPIPFMCSTKATDGTEMNITIPKITNVISLSKKSLLKKTNVVILNDQFLNKKEVPVTLMTSVSESTNPGQSSKNNAENRLNYINLSLKSPVLVTKYIQDRDCTNLSLLCVDRGQPLWQVNSDYLITTNVKLSFVQPSYWSTDGKDKRVRVFIDLLAQGSTVVEGMSIPDELFIDTNWYKKLNNDPVIYAKILYVVPNPKICQDMINQNVQLYLYSNTTGEMMPLLVQNNPNTNKKILVPVQLNVVKVAKTIDSEVISLDSEDE